MDKRYQVFVSSTYVDLIEERQEIMQALLELDCIPTGMELFPAADETQWEFIKKVIDDCDYYMVVVAGRYGSIGPRGLSYTEMEYRYALEIGKPILGFVHKFPDSLPANRCEQTEDSKSKLNIFRQLVQKKMCRFWDSPADLGGQVSRSLVKLIKSNPGIGWVRGNLIPNESASKELLALRRRVEELQAELEAVKISPPSGTTDLAQGSDRFTINYSLRLYSKGGDYGEIYQSSTILDWNEIFGLVAPFFIDEAPEPWIHWSLRNRLEDHFKLQLEMLKQSDNPNLQRYDSLDIDTQDLQTIKVQLVALGLIMKSTKRRTRRVSDKDTYWSLTPYGENVMTKLRAIRRNM